MQKANCFVFKMSIQDPKLLLHLVVVDHLWNGHPLLHTCKYPHCSWALTFQQHRTDENTHIAAWEFKSLGNSRYFCHKVGPRLCVSELYLCLHAFVRKIIVYLSKCMFVGTLQAILIFRPRSHPLALLTLRFLHNVSTTKTTGQCLLRVAVTISCLIQLCHKHQKPLAVPSINTTELLKEDIQYSS